jgi:NADPH:quinone reductase-like Zn-dependent oxidoreductase
VQSYEVQKFGLDGLTLAERPQPEPAAGEALVRVKAVSLNYRDLMMVQGVYNPKQKLPLIPCSDGAGEVVAVGAGVTRVKPGDRVMGIFSQTWIAGGPSKEKSAGTLGSPLDGMLTEFRCLSAEGLVKTPAHLTDEEASTLPCAAVTAWHALVERGGVRAGETVLVQGTGGLSMFALQFARMMGARVICISSSDEKLVKARALGATDTLNYKTTADWDKAVRELTGGVGVDHIVEVGGGATIGKSFRAIRIGGHIAVIGVLGGAASTDMTLVPILMQNLRINGVFVGSREMFEGMTKAITLGGLRPAVDRVFDFKEAPAALAYMQAGTHFGKIVVRVG